MRSRGRCSWPHAFLPSVLALTFGACAVGQQDTSATPDAGGQATVGDDAGSSPAQDDSGDPGQDTIVATLPDGHPGPLDANSGGGHDSAVDAGGVDTGSSALDSGHDTGVVPSDGGKCVGVPAWDPNELWTSYTVGELHTGSDGHLYACKNVAYCIDDPTSSVGATYGWTDDGPC